MRKPAMTGAVISAVISACGRAGVVGVVAVALVALPAPSVPAARAAVGAAAATATSPDRATTVFGHSVKGRDLVVHRVGDPTAERRVLVVGCIHGNECAGRAVVRELRRQAPREGTVYYLVPTLNPDGVARGTRQNARGVDLNRNFPKRWSRGDRGLYYPGRKALSEREARAAVRLLERVRPTFTVWYHQRLALVDHCGGSRKATKAYAARADVRFTRLPRYGGSVATWQHARWPRATILTVELGRRLSDRRADRHAAAVVKAALIAPALPTLG